MRALRRTPVLRVAISVLVFSLLSTVSTHDVDFDEVSNPVKEDPEVTIENVDDDVPEVEYFPPVPSGSVHFAESFDDFDSARKRWVISRAQKSDQDTVFKYNGQWDFDLPERPIFPLDKALILRSKAAHAAIAAKMEKRFDFNTKSLYVQYEVNFQHGMDCGGAYIKLLSYSKDLDLNNFHDKTPYSIMFGPDKCGNDIKIHFIFRHKNPINGTFEEKHAKRPSNRMEEVYSDKKPHLYRLVLTPDNKFEVYVDEVRVNRGNLLTDMTPPINPPEEIEDPNDQKPADWDEREKIPDITASKPEDWDEDAPAKIPDPSARKPEGWLEDEPEMIPDEKAVKPEDWDNEMDGPWEPPLITNPSCKDAPGCGPWIAPLIENPAFKGVWKPPLIPNPHYKGKWAPRKIPNPDFFEDKEPFRMTPISAVGLEIWTMTDGVLFDNFIITDDEAVLEDWTAQTYAKKKLALDRDSEGYLSRIFKYSNAHPWLWAVYVVVIGLPLVFIITFCCCQEKKIADHKKTDAVTEDSVAPEQPGKGANKASPAASSRRRNKVEVSRSKEELEAKKSSDNESELSENSVTKTSIGDTEANERSASNKAASSSSASALKDESSSVAEAGDAPRKRRARKD